MKKGPAAHTTLFIFLSYNGMGQICNILSKANAMIPDQLCSPVQVITGMSPMWA